MLEETKVKLEAAEKSGKPMPKAWYFKCLGNKKFVLKLETYWEAQEMKANPEYVEIDADGDLVLNPEDVAPARISMGPPPPDKRKK